MIANGTEMPAWQVILMVLVGVLGVLEVLHAFRVFGWNRKDKRHEALTVVIREFILCLQKLNDANRAQRTVKQLKASFVPESDHHEALQRVNQNEELFVRLIMEAEKAYKTTEVEFAAVNIRFPASIRKLLSQAIQQLSRLGELVNNGEFDDAIDIQQAKVADYYRRVMRMAHGWRPGNLFEWMSRKRLDARIEKENSLQEETCLVPEERMNIVSSLIHKRMTTQAGNSFAVHPPRVILDDPGIMERDTVSEELLNTSFKVVFQDGTTEKLSFPELMVFNYQLIFLAVQMGELSEKLANFGPAEVRITLALSIPEIMQPKVVKALLSKIEFSNTPCD